MERDFFEELSAEAGRAGLLFLVVGGHAVNAYGYQRTTIDADLVVDADQVPAWRAFWQARGYTCVHATDAFLQFRVLAPAGRFPVDLMLVSTDTFRKLRTERQQRAVGGATLDVPAPMHLVAMKLHALRHRAPAERDKDVQDIVGLVRRCGIDARGVEFRQVMERFGDESARAEIERRLERP